MAPQPEQSPIFDTECFVACRSAWLAQTASDRRAQPAAWAAIFISDCLNGEKGDAWPSTHTLARWASRSIDTAERAVACLVRLEHLTRTWELRAGQMRWVYRPLMKAPADPKGPPSFRAPAARLVVDNTGTSAPAPHRKSAAKPTADLRCSKPMKRNTSKEEPLSAAGDLKNLPAESADLTDKPTSDSAAAATALVTETISAEPIDPGVISAQVQGINQAGFARVVAAGRPAPRRRRPDPWQFDWVTEQPSQVRAAG